jgi:hypothetical protein
MEFSLHSVRGEWDCGPEAILGVQERSHCRDISTAPHRAYLRHAVALVQRGQTVKLTAPLAAEDSFSDRFVGSEQGQPV